MNKSRQWKMYYNSCLLCINKENSVTFGAQSTLNCGEGACTCSGPQGVAGSRKRLSLKWNSLRLPRDKEHYTAGERPGL